jgi:hypothetical protein
MKIKELIEKLQDCHPTAECSFQYYQDNERGWDVDLIGDSLQENRGVHSVTFAFVSKEKDNEMP